MISKPFAKQEIGRLFSIPFPPKTESGLDELVRTLYATARDEQHATATITQIIEGPSADGQRWPTPEEIRSVAWRLLPESEKKFGCHKCYGTGFVYQPKTHKGMVYEASAPCECRPMPPSDGEPERGGGIARVLAGDLQHGGRT